MPLTATSPSTSPSATPDPARIADILAEAEPLLALVDEGLATMQKLIDGWAVPGPASLTAGAITPYGEARAA